MLTRRSLLFTTLALKAQPQPRPNILLLLADNWAWPHASAAGDPYVRTPTFDKLAAQGALFTHAFAPNPSCSPSRSSLLTGQETHRLGPAANLYGPLSSRHATFVQELAKAGYFTGFAGKGWGPGTPADGGYSQNPCGAQFPDFESFLKARPKNQPFCFWFGSRDPHVPWDEPQNPRNPDRIPIPAHLPDVPEVRNDIRAYYHEIERFDAECARHLAALEKTGESPNTLAIMTSDNGWQLPRGLANCYDLGVRIPLAIRFPKSIPPAQKHNSFVTLADLCPTILAAAGCNIPLSVTGQSLLNPPARDAVFLERERHANVRRGDLTYPVRGIRTRQYLYLKNLEPDRWPAGDPEFYWAVGEYGDVDDSPSKRHMLESKAEPFFSLSFAKRPAEELYDVVKDPAQIHNLAADPKFKPVLTQLSARVTRWMRQTADPRTAGPTDLYDIVPYSGPKFRGKP